MEQQPTDTTTGRKQIIAKHWRENGIPARAHTPARTATSRSRSAVLNGLHTKRTHNASATNTTYTHHSDGMALGCGWCARSMENSFAQTHTTMECWLAYRRSGNVATLHEPAAPERRWQKWTCVFGICFSVFFISGFYGRNRDTCRLLTKCCTHHRKVNPPFSLSLTHFYLKSSSSRSVRLSYDELWAKLLTTFASRS